MVNCMNVFRIEQLLLNGYRRTYDWNTCFGYSRRWIAITYNVPSHHIVGQPFVLDLYVFNDGETSEAIRTFVQTVGINLL